MKISKKHFQFVYNCLEDERKRVFRKLNENRMMITKLAKEQKELKKECTERYLLMKEIRSLQDKHNS